MKWGLTLAVVALAGLMVWMYVVPMVTANAVTVYDEYTVGTGDIQTEKSFSATLSVKKSETLYPSEECTVREIYVQSGAEVQNGDPLVLLSTGELFSASFDGVVNEIRVSVGDWVWPRMYVVQVCDLEHLEVSMSVDEYDVKGLSVGQACTVTIISLGQDIQTQIAHINRVSEASSTVALYSVTCDLTVPENILPGMQASVTLPSDSAQGVATLDVAALAFDSDQNPYVLVRDAAGNYQKTPVETGLSDGMKVEITSGVTSGQTVYAVSGTENAQSGLTLQDLYNALVGKTVVIQDQSQQGGRGERPDMSGAAAGGDITAAGTADGQTGAQTAVAGDGGDATSGATAQTGQTQTSTTTDQTTQTAAATDSSGAQSDTGARPQPPSGGGPGAASDAQATAAATADVTPTPTTAQ